jgi:hypothetical protein
MADTRRVGAAAGLVVAQVVHAPRVGGVGAVVVSPVPHRPQVGAAVVLVVTAIGAPEVPGDGNGIKLDGEPIYAGADRGIRLVDVVP